METSIIPQDVIEKMVKPQVLKDNEKNGKFWGREIKIVRTYFSKFPDMEFWKWFTLPFKLNSMAFLRTGKGKMYFLSALKEWEEKNKKNEPIIFEQDKIGDSFIQTKKTNSLLNI